MGGFGPRPPYPGQYGPRYGAPQPPSDLVSSRTPVANKLVEGINSFIGGFQQSQESEKQKARQEFFEGVSMMQLGLQVDQKKLARAARKGELPFDFGGESKPQQQAPMPGQGQAPPMMGGGGMPGGGAPPMPGAGGGQGFFGRLGAAISDPFRAAAQRNAPIPGDAGMYQALGQLQQRSQQSQELASLEQQANIAKAKDVIEFLKTGDPKIAAKLNNLTSMPDALQSLFTISGMMGDKADTGKALGSMMDDLTGASKHSAQRATLINQTARAIQGDYDNFEMATKAATAVIDNGSLPDDLKPTKAGAKRSEAITNRALDLMARYRKLSGKAAFSISAILEDPLATEEEKAAATAPLDNLKTIGDEQLDIARQNLNVSLKGLDIRIGNEERDARLRARVSDLLIAASDPATGMLDYAKARKLATEESRRGLHPSLEDDLGDVMKYIDAAERGKLDDAKNQLMLKFVMDQLNSGGGGDRARGLPPPTAPPPGQ